MNVEQILEHVRHGGRIRLNKWEGELIARDGKHSKLRETRGTLRKARALGDAGQVRCDISASGNYWIVSAIFI